MQCAWSLGHCRVIFEGDNLNLCEQLLKMTSAPKLRLFLRTIEAWKQQFTSTTFNHIGRKGKRALHERLLSVGYITSLGTFCWRSTLDVPFEFPDPKLPLLKIKIKIKKRYKRDRVYIKSGGFMVSSSVFMVSSFAFLSFSLNSEPFHGDLYLLQIPDLNSRSLHPRFSPKSSKFAFSF